MLKIKNHPGKTIAQFFLTPKFSNVALFCLEGAPLFLCHSQFPPILIPSPKTPKKKAACFPAFSGHNNLAKGIAEWNRDRHSRGVAWHGNLGDVEWWSSDFMTWHHSSAKVSKWDMCIDLSNHIPRQVKREISLHLETVKGASLGWHLRKWSMLGLVASWTLNDFLVGKSMDSRCICKLSSGCSGHHRHSPVLRGMDVEGRAGSYFFRFAAVWRHFRMTNSQKCRGQVWFPMRMWGKMGGNLSKFEGCGSKSGSRKNAWITPYHTKQKHHCWPELQASQNTGCSTSPKETKAGCRPEQLNLPEDVALDSRLTREINWMGGKTQHEKEDLWEPWNFQVSPTCDFVNLWVIFNDFQIQMIAMAPECSKAMASYM